MHLVSDGQPEKSYYKNTEVSSMTGVKPYVLRFWENEFPELDPVTSSSGHKLYEWNHIQIVRKIKELLFEQKLTIDSAKLFLREFLEQTKNEAAPSVDQDNQVDADSKRQTREKIILDLQSELHELVGLTQKLKAFGKPLDSCNQ